MTERKKAAAAPKAVTPALAVTEKSREPEKNYVLVKNQGEPKHLTSAELADTAKREAPKVTPPRRGPQTGEASMSDVEYIAAFGSPDELTSLRNAVAARRARDPKLYVFMRCDRCGLALKLPADLPEDGVCVRCNWARRGDGGHMRRMTDQQINDHLYQQAIRDKAEGERELQAALYRANQRRGQAGLPPFAPEEFKKLRETERREQIERDQQLGQVASLYRRRP